MMAVTLGHKQQSSLINRLLPASLIQLKLIRMYSMTIVQGDRNVEKKNKGGWRGGSKPTCAF